MNNLKLLLCILLIGFLTSCSSKLLTVHKIDVQQGNALDAEMVDKIEIIYRTYFFRYTKKGIKTNIFK